MEDVLGVIGRFIGLILRGVLEALLEWFWHSGISKLPRRISQVPDWWRRESAVSIAHSVIALITLVAVAIGLVLGLVAFFGLGPLS